MLPDDLAHHGEHVLTACNSCRYCEAYCAVFPAMEQRSVFVQADLTYLANLCHNCGECLYACPYAPPHEFGIDVPRTMARLRLASYEEFCWPRPLAATFRRNGLWSSLALASALSAVLVWFGGTSRPAAAAHFYAVISHGVMVSLFGAAGVFAAVALVIGLTRFWRTAMASSASRPTVANVLQGLRDAASLRYLHSEGIDCASGEESRSRWRRWCHHLTMYGFLLCVASTTVAAVYHSVLGWEAPYPYRSAPVLLGTAGGLGMLVGVPGLFLLKRRRDPDLGDPDQVGLDTAFMTLLTLSTITGLFLLLRREQSDMPLFLSIHLGSVLALFLTMPYGKLVHAIYRTAALIKFASEQAEAPAAVVPLEQDAGSTRPVDLTPV